MYLISCWYFSHQAALFLDLIKVDDKSAVWRSDDGPVWSCDGPGESFAYWAKEYSSGAERFIVGDEKLRRLIKSNLVSRWLLVIFVSLRA